MAAGGGHATADSTARPAPFPSWAPRLPRDRPRGGSGVWSAQGPAVAAGEDRGRAPPFAAWRWRRRPEGGSQSGLRRPGKALSVNVRDLRSAASRHLCWGGNGAGSASWAALR